MLLLYRVCIYLALPIFLLRLLYKAIKNPLYRPRLLERFAIYSNSAAIQKGGICVHAVSVGEVNAAAGLIKKLQKQYPDLPITVTSMTPTGSQRILDLFGNQVQHVYLPYDYIGAMSRFLHYIQPRLLIVMETEIWPNLFMQCHRNGIQLVLSNVRLSKRSFKSYKRFSTLTQTILKAVSVFLVQSKSDAAHIKQLGADKERVFICGNVKFDITASEKYLNMQQATKDALGNRPVWVAASTRDGEEEKVLFAYKKVKEAIPNILLVLVPRHPERANQIESLVKKANFALIRFSQNQWLQSVNDDFMSKHEYHRKINRKIDDEIDILLIDAIGQLAQYYAAADIAFVGGSLVNTGCQNVLEPCAYQTPVIFGPSVYNFKQITALLLQADGAIQVTNSDELASQVITVLQHPKLSKSLQQNANQVIQDNAGALDRQVEYIKKLL